MAKNGDKMTLKIAQKLKSEGLNEVVLPTSELVGKYSAVDVINEETGEIYLEAGGELTEAILAEFEAVGINEVRTLFIDHVNIGPYIRNTLMLDKNDSRERALEDIYRVMRPGEPHTLPETADAMFRSLFFDLERYDLSSVGRVKMNGRLNQTVEDSVRISAQERYFGDSQMSCLTSRTAAGRSMILITSAIDGFVRLGS